MCFVKYNPTEIVGEVKEERERFYEGLGHAIVIRIAKRTIAAKGNLAY